MSHRKSRGSTAPALTLAQFNAAVDAVQQAVGDLDEGQHVGKAVRPANRRPCASDGEAKRLYSQLEGLVYEGGQPPPPDPFAAEYGEWWDPTLRAYAKWNWWKWCKEWRRWAERVRARLTAAEGASKGRPAEKLASAFPWEDDDWDDLTPLTRRLLKYMGDRERADITDFVEAVWGKDYGGVNDPAIHAAVSRANRSLAKHNYPHHLTKPRGESIVRWV
jgi:hypothetical protein